VVAPVFGGSVWCQVVIRRGEKAGENMRVIAEGTREKGWLWLVAVLAGSRVAACAGRKAWQACV